MSTGMECWISNLVTKHHGSGWFYFLETIYGPDGGDMDVYGPFQTQDEAWAHLHNHHSNPGGATTDPENSIARIPYAYEAKWLESNYQGR